MISQLNDQFTDHYHRLRKWILPGADDERSANERLPVSSYSLPLIIGLSFPVIKFGKTS